MTGHPWTSAHRDALLSRVTVLTAGTAAVSAIGAVGLGAGLQVGTHYRQTSGATARSTVTTSPAQSASKPSTAVAPSTVSPRHVHVMVLNGTGAPGAARQAADALASAGFSIAGIGNSPDTPVAATTIAYDPSQTAEMRTLSDATGVSAATPTGSGPVLVLTIGPDWTGTITTSGGTVHATYTPPPAPPAPVLQGGGGSATSGGS